MFKHCINMELIKTTTSWGNSAGVLLPREWKNKEVKIILIDRTSQVKKEIFDILNSYLDDIIGIYLVGSYARNEQTQKSDIDLLVITNKINKRIERGKYSIILIPEEKIKKQLERNILPLLPMLKEAKPILNAPLIEGYKETRLTKKNIKWHIDTTKSAMNVVKASIKVSKEIGINESDASAYSLILRLRTLYIIDCLKNNKIWTKKDFLRLVKKIAGSLISYEEYLRVKAGNKKIRDKLPLKEAENLMNYNNKKIREIEKWVKEKKIRKTKRR